MSVTERLERLHRSYRNAWILGEPDVRPLLEELVTTIAMQADQIRELRELVDHLIQDGNHGQ